MCLNHVHTYQIAWIGEEGLLDQWKAVASEASLQLQQMGKYPWFVLSQNNPMIAWNGA